MSLLPRGKDVPSDLLVGLSLLIIVIPQSMAHAALAGLPPQFGLYTASLPVMIAMIFGRMNHLSAGPTVLTAVIAGMGLSALAVPGTVEYIRLAVLLGGLVGLVKLIMGIFRFSFLANLISHPVNSAFSSAVAILIIMGQLHSALGIDAERVSGMLGSLRAFGMLAADLGEIHLPSLIFSVGFIAISTLTRRFVKSIPSNIPPLLLALALSPLLGYHSRLGGEIIGELPRRLLFFGGMFGTAGGASGVGTAGFAGAGAVYTIAELGGDLLRLLPAAFLTATIALMEMSSVARYLQQQGGEEPDLDGDLRAHGLGGILGTLVSAFPMSVSFSRSALARRFGAKSRLSLVTAAVLVIPAMLLLGRVLAYIPKAVLAALIIASVAGIINFASLKQSFRVSRADGSLWLLTFAVTLLAAPMVHWGIITGVLASLLMFFARRLRPRLVLLGRHADGRLRDAEELGLPVSRYILPLRMDSSLHFGNADYFIKTITGRIYGSPELKYLLLAAEGIHHIDSSGEQVLRRLLLLCRSRGIEFHISGLKLPPRRMLVRSGFAGEIGEAHLGTDSETVLRELYAELENNGLEDSADLRMS